MIYDIAAAAVRGGAPPSFWTLTANIRVPIGKKSKVLEISEHCCRFVFKQTLGEYVRRNGSSQWRNLWEGAC